MSETLKKNPESERSGTTPAQIPDAAATTADEGFLAKNLSIIAPEIVSLCAVLIFALQLLVGYFNSQTQAITEQMRIESQRRVEEAKFNIQFSLNGKVSYVTYL